MKNVLLVVALMISTASFAAEKDLKAARDYVQAGISAKVPHGTLVRRMLNDGYTEAQIEKLMAELKQDPQRTAELVRLFSPVLKPVSPN